MPQPRPVPTTLLAVLGTAMLQFKAEVLSLLAPQLRALLVLQINNYGRSNVRGRMRAEARTGLAAASKVLVGGRGKRSGKWPALPNAQELLGGELCFLQSWCSSSCLVVCGQLPKHPIL